MFFEEKDGGIFIRPVGWHDKSQEYFWTREWQEKMKRSKEAMDKGEYKSFDSVDDLLADLGVEHTDEEDGNAENSSN
ncbi:hypothetical protein [Ammoniphilus sp. CFH 90114]|uniref:hypothetical protein n=1 Tax=Ammoniphilus sp. CFH 90114 TaxID=2493665 RepID=UPI00196A65BC|nr:hypothetical protein [Ammoniphilus sp. CFH 90114]